MPGRCQNQACFTGIPGMARAEYPGKNSTIWHGFSLLLYHRSQSACSGPVHPENPWRVGSANLTKLVDKALEYAWNVPSRQEMAAALLTRGYTTSDIDAYAAVTPQLVRTFSWHGDAIESSLVRNALPAPPALEHQQSFGNQRRSSTGRRGREWIGRWSRKLPLRWD